MSETHEPPATLSDDAKARWAAVYPALAKRGEVDVDTLATYCQVWARWRQAEAMLQKSSILVKGKGGAIVQSPLVSVSNQTAAQARALEKQLGIGEEPASLGIRAFARELGVDDKAVRKAIASGRIPASVVGRNAKGQPEITDPSAARTAWFANAQKPARGEDDGSQSLVSVQRQVAEQRARRLQFENDLRSGAYVSLRDAQREAFESARTIRESLLNLPARLAPELAVEGDAAKIYILLDTEIRKALTSLADALDRAAS